MSQLLKQIERRLDQAGCLHDIPTLHLAIDLFAISVNETRTWTNRCDDAMRIPDVLDEVRRGLKQRVSDLNRGLKDCCDQNSQTT